MTGGLLIANVGVLALYLLFIWMAAAIIGGYLSARKGYGEKVGLACGLLLSAPGALIWLFVPAKEDSDWKVVGPMPWHRREA